MLENNNKEDYVLPEYMGYPTFSDVQDGRLRAYNRIVMFLKMWAERGLEAAEGYIKAFPRNEKKVIANVQKDIKERGAEIVRLEIMEKKNYV